MNDTHHTDGGSRNVVLLSRLRFPRLFNDSGRLN